MIHSQPAHTPSLIDVQLAFEQWRSQRTARQPTPEHLRSLAVALLEQHLPFTISKALGVNGTALKQWATTAPQTSKASFVALPDEPDSEIAPAVVVADPAVLIHLPNGVQVSVTQGLSLNQVLSAASSLGANT